MDILVRLLAGYGDGQECPSYKGIPGRPLRNGRVEPWPSIVLVLHQRLQRTAQLLQVALQDWESCFRALAISVPPHCLQLLGCLEGSPGKEIARPALDGMRLAHDGVAVAGLNGLL